MTETRVKPAAGAQPSELVDELEKTGERIRAEARQELGITGQEKAEPLRKVLREAGVGLYPLIAISSLSLTNIFFRFGYDVLAPDIARSLGLGIGAIAAIGATAGFAVALSPLPTAYLVQGKPRRALLAILTGLAWSLLTAYAGFVTGVVTLLFVVIFDGFTTGSVTALHYPLVMDCYPPKARVRAAAVYTGAGQIGLGLLLGPLAVSGLSSVLHLTWRGVFVGLGVLSLIGCLVAVRLRDPGYGRFDTDRVRRSVRRAHGEKDAVKRSDVELGFFEILRRLLLIPTIRRIVLGNFILGIFSIPLNTFVAFFLDERYGLGPTGRGFFFGLTAATGIIVLALFAKRGEGWFGQDPARVLRLAGIFLAVTVTVFGSVVFMPNLAWVAIMFCAGFGIQILYYPMLNVAGLTVVEARFRAHLQALEGIFLSAGGILGSIFLSGIEERFGIGGALFAVAIPGVISAAVIYSANRFISQDIDRMIEQVAEEEEIGRIHESGGRLPMLACRNIDFSYGQLQVLFDVDFTVDEGEMVALLGVNGAGKSTLLKVISGIGLPTRGSVRLSGQDVTFLDAERRLRLGIAQVPGGRAVFPPLSVVDNLRVYGYALGKNGESIDQAIERCFQAFPQLAERRNQLANTLSGGEQQMLGLCKALILRPRLLLIDELSLGLAPVVVTRLLEMVREINASGTAVVLVEQSATIALSVARHAYFMEKGEIRFDGPSEELLRRKDLLRAVFLKGAGARG